MKDRTQAEAPPVDLERDGLEAYAPYLMNRILRRYNEAVDRDVRTGGLSVPSLRILAALVARGGLSVNDLATLAVIEQSSASRLVDAMLRQGLVRRDVSETDSRSRIVSLTAEGRARFDDLFPAMQGAEVAMMEGLSPQERDVLIGLLHRMLANVRQSPI